VGRHAWHDVGAVGRGFKPPWKFVSAIPDDIEWKTQRSRRLAPSEMELSGNGNVARLLAASRTRAAPLRLGAAKLCDRGRVAEWQTRQP
jgi:hypothetical protein